MDRRERGTTDEEVLRTAFAGLQSRLWTQLVGVVQAFNVANQTVTVQPAVNGRIQTPNGTYQSSQLPQLIVCPLLFPGGGGVTLFFPVKQGDEVLVMFASRCIDTWFARGWTPATITAPSMKNDPPEWRMHNLSDGFAFVGPRSVPRLVANPPNGAGGAAALWSDDGSTYVSVNPTTKTVAITAPNGVTVNGVTIDSAGNVITPGNLTVGTGATGSFTTPTGQTVDVQDGIITNIY